MPIRPPWTGFLKFGMPILSLLVLSNTLAIFLMTVITVATTHFYAIDNALDGLAYLERHDMRMSADIIFFYVTIPTVMLVETAASNYCLWTDSLNPKYAAVMAILAAAVWIAQTTLWGVCLFAGGPRLASQYGYCPNAFKTDLFHVGMVQHIGSKEMAVWGVPSLFVLYAFYFAFALIARRREKGMHPRSEYDDYGRKWYAFVSQTSDDEKRLRVSAKHHVPVRPQAGQTNKPPPGVLIEEQTMSQLGQRPY